MRRHVETCRFLRDNEQIWYLIFIGINPLILPPCNNSVCLRPWPEGPLLTTTTPLSGTEQREVCRTCSMAVNLESITIIMWNISSLSMQTWRLCWWWWYCRVARPLSLLRTHPACLRYPTIPHPSSRVTQTSYAMKWMTSSVIQYTAVVQICLRQHQSIAALNIRMIRWYGSQMQLQVMAMGLCPSSRESCCSPVHWYSCVWYYLVWSRNVRCITTDDGSLPCIR